MMNGRLIPYSDAHVHVLSTAMKYAASVYEAMRAYMSDAEQQLYVFRLREHLQRLQRSAKIARIPLPADLRAARGGHARGHPRQRPARGPARAPHRLRRHRRRRPRVPRAGRLRRRADPDRPLLRGSGLHVAVSSWDRSSDNAIPPAVKAAANYQNSRLALLQAKIDGYDDAILLNSDGSVAEGPGYTLFLVRDDRPITSPVTSNILEGVTRATLLTLFREALSVDPCEREVDRTELYIADEAFFAGTAAEVTPILSVDRHPIGDGAIGPLTAKVRDAYFQVVRGGASHPEWRTPVYP
jgi:branched-chain amino acid aminotransferase